MITAVDVGATKTLIAQFKDSTTPINRVRFETPQLAPHFIKILNYHLTKLDNITALSIGLAGQISNDGSTIAYCGNLPWRNVPLKKMLTEQYHCPVYLQNDAVMAGLGEINALPTVPNVGYYLSLGTGIGGAVIVDGQLIPALTHGEAGHMPLKTADGWKEWEDIASGSAIVKQFGKLAKDITSAQEWQWVAENLAHGLGPIITTLQPNVIVIGGGVGRYFDNFQGYLAKKLRRHLPEFIAIPHLVRAQHADDAVLYGCYYHANTN